MPFGISGQVSETRTGWVFDPWRRWGGSYSVVGSSNLSLGGGDSLLDLAMGGTGESQFRVLGIG